MKKEYIIPIFVPHLGCPNNCTFCNQKKISGQTKMVTKQDVKDTIEYYLKNFKDDHKYVEVAFFGGSFTAIEKEKQEEEIFLGFRKLCGLNTEEINKKYSIDFEKIYKDVLEKYISYGYLEKTASGYKLTDNGILVSNVILADFI